MNHGLPEKVVAQICAVLSEHAEVEKVILYGSRAKGNYKPGSDIDLTLLGSALTPKILGQIQSEFDDGPLPYRCDLSIFSKITTPDLLDHIQRVGVVFYEQKLASAK
ncbi:MAG TPA: nucleotidyltransferase domain-containing protein [Candidatus Saccharimonadales bacterium]|nr:nucleotidyltransferase domain-containing protein [Candidatus Saccharimonadales bacterium]